MNILYLLLSLIVIVLVSIAFDLSSLAKIKREQNSILRELTVKTQHIGDIIRHELGGKQ